MPHPEFVEQKRLFDEVAKIVPKVLYVHHDGESYPVDVIACFDPTLFKHKRVGGYALGLCKGQKFGYSLDYEMGRYIDYSRLVRDLCKGVCRKAQIYVSTHRSVVCAACHDQGWYVDFQNRKPCPECQT